jgi:hypothetical protein
MNSNSKIFSVLLYLIWPFTTFFNGIKNFDNRVGKNNLIALYAFLGYTAVSIGDLERYEDEFYHSRANSFSNLFAELLTLQTGKFYNSFISVIVGSIFESHHFYFLILFLFYGYFYINSIYILKTVSFKHLHYFGYIFFSGLLLFMLVRPIANLAYYTGGVFISYTLISYYQTNNKKFLLLLLFAPLFHIGLSIYLIIPPLLLIFKNKSYYYVFFVLLSFAVGKSNVVGAIENFSTSNPDTILESKFNSFATDDAQMALEERYAEGALNNNIKLNSLLFFQKAILSFFVPIGMFLLFFNRKLLLFDNNSKLLFHITLLFWGVSNLMLNISQGERFVVLFGFIATALFFVVYIKTMYLSEKTVFNKFLYIFVPLLFLFGIMSAYASNPIFSIEFFISNFFIEFFIS